jgi:Flp pilus assembly protein TadD
MTLWGDFTFKEGRLRLKIDRDAKTHPALFISARKYSKLGMWGLSIIHLRRAIAQHQRNSSYHAALAVAYMNIKRYDLADKTLSQAEKLGPNTTQIWRLRKQLDSLKSETVR